MSTGKPYTIAIYDANCIIYQCFHLTWKVGSRQIELKFPMLTDRVHLWTSQLLNHGKKIETIRLVIDEIYRKGFAEIIEDFCKEPSTKHFIVSHRDPYRGRVRPAIKLKLEINLKNKLERLCQQKDWFNIVDFLPDQTNIRRIKSFYNSLKLSSKMVAHLNRKKRKTPYSSEVDIALLIYSWKISAPILTNDSDITEFKPELINENLCLDISCLREEIPEI